MAEMSTDDSSDFEKLRKYGFFDEKDTPPLITGSVIEQIIFEHQDECINYYSNGPLGGVHCKPEFDDYICWPPTDPGTNISHQCPRISSIGGHILGYTTISDAYAVRYCDFEGKWINQTDFGRCLEHIDELYEDSVLQKVVAYILFVGCIFSLITLIISLGIFCHFQSLSCPRLKVHKNLCTALIIHLILLFISAIQNIFNVSHYLINWLCKTMLGLQMYSSMASINWMFVEGLLLHNKVAVNIFSRDAPFKLYYFIGWGLPAILIGTWSGLMEVFHKAHCWKYFSQSDFIYIVVVPIITALVVNLIFLINIIRVLVTKRPANVSVERMQIKKAVKATALLFPLLGITHLMFCCSPKDSENAEAFFILANSFIQSTQGLFVAILYCFMNTDVQRVVRNAYRRSWIARNPSRFPISRFISLTTSNTYAAPSENVAAAAARVPVATSVQLKCDNEGGSSISMTTFKSETKVCVEEGPKTYDVIREGDESTMV